VRYERSYYKTCVQNFSLLLQFIENESVPIQLAQCRFLGLAISNAKILINFSNKIYGSNFVKQHSETAMVWNYQNVVRSAVFLNKLTVLFIIIFGTLSSSWVGSLWTSADRLVLPGTSSWSLVFWHIVFWQLSVRTTPARERSCQHIVTPMSRQKHNVWQLDNLVAASRPTSEILRHQADQICSMVGGVA